MIDIAPEQIKKKYENLPEVLKNALFSASNADKIWQISNNFKINDANQIAAIGKLAGWVIMGLIKIEESAKTIQGDLNLDADIASLIAKELESKIFAPLKGEINKLTASSLNSLSEEIRYRVTGDILKSNQSTSPLIQINRVEITPPPTPPPAPEKPKVALTPQPAIPQQSNAQTQNAPVMIYKKEEPKPLAASIKTQIRGEMTADTKPEIKQTPARVEIGPEAETLTSGTKKEPFGAAQDKPFIARTPQPEFPKVVHYTDFKTPINGQGQVAAPITPVAVKPETAAPQTEEVVDLSSFKPEKKTAPINQPAGAPKIQGNTLDLR